MPRAKKLTASAITQLVCTPNWCAKVDFTDMFPEGMPFTKKNLTTLVTEQIEVFDVEWFLQKVLPDEYKKLLELKREFLKAALSKAAKDQVEARTSTLELEEAEDHFYSEVEDVCTSVADDAPEVFFGSYMPKLQKAVVNAIYNSKKIRKVLK